MSREIKHGSTDQSTLIRFLDATSGEPTDVDHATAGLALWYRREGGLKVTITPAALGSADAAHTDGGVEAIDDGLTRVDVPDAAFLTGAAGVTIGGTATGLVCIPSYHPLEARSKDDLATEAKQDTVDSAVDAIKAVTDALPDSGGLDDLATLASRLTAARAGYLDNLNIGGNVASSAEVVAIQNNTRVVRVVPTTMERPDAGSTAFRIELLLYDSEGNMEAPDSAPTIGVVNQSGTDRSANLDATTMTLVSTGRYRSTYDLDVGDDIEQLLFTFSVVEGGATRQYGNTTQVVDTTAVDFTAADRAKLDEMHDNRLTSGRASALDNLDATVSSRNATTPPTAAAIRTEIDSNSTQLAKLGTPAGASVSADIAEVLKYQKSEAVLLKTGGGWQISVRVLGSTAAASPVELYKLDLFDADGAAITAATTPIATMQGE